MLSSKDGVIKVITDNGLVLFQTIPCDASTFRFSYTRGVQDRRYPNKRDKRSSNFPHHHQTTSQWHRVYMVHRHITHNTSNSDIVISPLFYISTVRLINHRKLLHLRVFSPIRYLCVTLFTFCCHVSMLWCVFVCYLGACVYVCIHMEDYHTFLCV